MESADYWRGREDQIKASRSADEKLRLGIALAAIVALPVAVWLVPSYYEAQTYRNLTGADVTMWDAMWVELRDHEPDCRLAAVLKAVEGTTNA